MFKNIIWLTIVIMVFILFSCTPEAKPQDIAEKKGSEPVANGIQKTGWEADWERTLRDARKEGRVVIYGGSTAAALKLHATKLIKEKFGFDLEVLTATAGELRVKISSERSVGLFIPDIYASGIAPIYNFLKPKGWVDHIEPMLILPEVLDPKAWYGGELSWGDKERKTFNWPAYSDQQIAINTNLLKPDEITSFQDLLHPNWKGKIVINDPSIEGVAQTGFSAMLYNKMVNLDFFEELVRKQNPTVIRDQHLQIIWLAREKFPVALWPSEGRMAEYIAAGAPISWIVTKEGVLLAGGGGGLALMNNAPHPNAAKILLNWFLSKEGQYLIQGATNKQSARVDIPTDNVDPISVRKPGVKYLPQPNNSDEEFVLRERDRYMELARQIFGPLTGR